MDLSYVINSLGRPDTYVATFGGRDGTTAVGGTNLVVLAGLPITPVSADIIGIVQFPSGVGSHVKMYLSARHGGEYTFTYAAGNLTVASVKDKSVPTFAGTDNDIWVLYSGDNRTATLITDLIDQHDTPPDNAYGAKILVEALTNPAASQVASGDLTRPRATIDGAVLVGGYDDANTQSEMLRILKTDSAAGTKGLPVGAEAISGVPTAIDSTDFGLLVTDLTRSLRTYPSIGSDKTTSSMETWEKPPTGLSEGSQQISNAAATALNGGTSLTCTEVTVQNQLGNSPIAIGGSGIAAVANDGIVLQAGDSITILIDDVAKVYGFATVLNERLDWTCSTRA